MLLIYQIHEDVQVMADYIADPVKTSFVQNNEKINLVSTVNCSDERHLPMKCSSLGLPEILALNI